MPRDEYEVEEYIAGGEYKGGSRDAYPRLTLNLLRLRDASVKVVK